MRHLFSALLAVLILAGCDHVEPLTLAQRARFISELLEDGADCNAFRQRLAVPSLEQSEIDAVYREAKKVACIKRDV